MHGGFVERFKHCAADRDAFQHFANDFVEDRTGFMLERKEVTAALIANLQ